jgi:putative ABC transport system permease protein
VIGVSLKGLWGRKLRTFLTALAIVLGVSMISGTYVLTDTITHAFDSIFSESYKNADAVITGKVAFENEESGTTETPAFPAKVLEEVRQLPDVEAASGTVADEARLVDRDGDIISSGGAPARAFGIDP